MLWLVLVVAGSLAFSGCLAPSEGAKKPGAPEGLKATPGEGKITLTWQPPSDTGGAAIKAYRIYRGLQAGKEVFLVQVGNILTHTDPGLVNGQTYHYKVSAKNSAGEGQKSSPASAVPLAPARLPTEPKSPRAIGSDGKVLLEWQPPSSDGGSPILSYLVYRGPSEGAETYLADAGTALSYLNTGLTNRVPYFYRVSARNSAGEGPRSATVSATPFGSPTAPDVPRNLAAVAGSGNITLTWDPPVFDGGSPILNYILYRGTASGALAKYRTLGTAVSLVDEGLLNGYTFHYKVSAENQLGEGPATPEASATTFSAPGAPQNLRHSPGLGSIALAWDPPAREGGTPVTNYIMYKGTAPGGESYLLMIGNVTTYTDAPVANETKFYYQVSARNVMGEGARSEEHEAMAVSTLQVPGAPTGLRAVPGDGTVSLSWAPPAFDGGTAVTSYSVYRNGALLASAGLALTYQDGGLTNGVPYSYEVSAVNSIGEGARCAAVEAVPAKVPGPPQGLNAVGGNRNVALSWQAPMTDGGSPVVNYTVFRNGGLLVTLGVVNTHLDLGLVNGQTYTYKVAAVNKVGTGDFSNEAAAVPVVKPVAFSAGGSGRDGAVDMGSDGQGNLYITGSFEGTVDFDPGTGSAPLTSAGGNDIYLAKYDRDGGYLWAFGVGGAGADAPRGMTVDLAGNALLAGYFSLVADFDPGAGAANLASFGLRDGFLARYDPSGNYKWAFGLGSSIDDDEAQDVSADPSGNAIVTGHYNGTVDFDPGPSSYASTSNLSRDIFAASYDPDGKYRWHQSLGSDGPDGGLAAAAATNGTCYIAGSFNGSVDFRPGPEEELYNASGGQDIFIASFLPGGAWDFAKGFGGPGEDLLAPGGMSLDVPGDIYLTGSFNDICDFEPSNLSANYASNGGQDIFVVKYSYNGLFLWAMNLGGPGDDAGARVEVDGAGNIYATGRFRGTVDFDFSLESSPLTASGTGGASDIFLAKYGPGGLHTWAVSFGASVSGAESSSGGLALCLDIFGNVAIAGEFCGAADFDPTSGTTPLTSAGATDIFVARYDAEGKPG